MRAQQSRQNQSGQQRQQAAMPWRGLLPRSVSQLAVVGLLVSVLAVTAACAQQTPGGAERPSASPATTATDGTPGTPAATGTAGSLTPTGTAAAAIDLSITLTESPDATARQFRLVADGSTPSPESTLPDPAAALAAVEAHGEKLFFPVPDPNRMCTDQYGGPQIAVVTGWFNGKAVNATFKRTNGCEIASWTALAPLFGALAGGTGAS